MHIGLTESIGWARQLIKWAQLDKNGLSKCTKSIVNQLAPTLFYADPLEARDDSVKLESFRLGRVGFCRQWKDLAVHKIVVVLGVASTVIWASNSAEKFDRCHLQL